MSQVAIKHWHPKESSVSVAGSTDQRTITATFSITMDGRFLPMQIIYSEKTSKSIPPVSFPDSFLVSANTKHYSNEKESLKMLEHKIIPYVKKQRQKLSLDPHYPAQLIMDVFKGQMTKQVKDLLNENNIKLQKVPANLTYLFQPLDVQGGPNGHVLFIIQTHCPSSPMQKITLFKMTMMRRMKSNG